MVKTKVKKGPGRPEKQDSADDRRDVLLQTAAKLFGERGYEGVSMKEICREADVSPAMIAYYFKDKRGLLHAVMESGLNALLDVLRAIGGQKSDASFAEHFIENYIRVINRKPWLPRILVREVLSRDSELRELFLKNFASHVIKIVPPRIADDIDRGMLRSDLDPRYTLLSILGMCVMPYIAVPVLGPLLGYELGDDFAETYSVHVKNLLMHGAGGERT